MWARLHAALTALGKPPTSLGVALLHCDRKVCDRIHMFPNLIFWMDGPPLFPDPRVICTVVYFIFNSSTHFLKV